MRATGSPVERLDGLSVLVTRPREQSLGLCSRLQCLGAEVVRFPLLEVAPAPDVDALRARWGERGDHDWLVYVSANAVGWALRLFGAIDPPPGTRVAAVGSATEAALAAAGVSVDLRPAAQFNSEQLLAAPAWQAVEGQRFLLLRGQGGRELLTDTLRARGARVEHLELYRRRCPDPSRATVLRDWVAAAMPRVLTLTSGDALRCLLALLDDARAEQVRQLPTALLSERLKALAVAEGFCGPLAVAPEASDAGLIRAVCLLAWGAGGPVHRANGH